MAKNRISACWLLLMIFLFAAACVLGTGQAQARYTNTVTWNTVMDASVDTDQVTSDFLENVSNPPVTILLSELAEEEYEVSFTLKSGVPVTGPLNWAVDRYEYVDVVMTLGEGETAVELTPGQDLAIPGDSKGVTLTMTLYPTTKAMTENHPALDVNIQVAWGETLRGTFLTFLPARNFDAVIPLPPVDPEDTDPTDPEATDPTDPEDTDPTDPEATDPTEPEQTQPTDPNPAGEDPQIPDPASEEDQSQPEEPLPSETNESMTENTDLSYKSSKFSANVVFSAPDQDLTRKSERNIHRDEPESPGPEEESEGEPAPNEETGEDPTEEPEENPTEEPGEDPAEGNPEEEPSGETEESIPDPKVEIKTVRTFKTDDVLLVEVQMLGRMSAIELGMGFRNKTGEEGIEPIPFPRHLRYSLDGGNSYYHLYQDSLIALTPNTDGYLYLLMDWSRVNLTANQLELAAAAYEQGEMVASDLETTAPQQTWDVTLSSRILDTAEPLIIRIPQAWQGYTLEYEVQVLTSPRLADGSYGPVTYQTLDLEEEPEQDPENPGEEPTEESAAKMLILTQTDAGLEIRIGQELPEAGTYRILMNWKSGDASVEQAQVIFYINYSANKETLLTGGAEQ